MRIPILGLMALCTSLACQSPNWTDTPLADRASVPWTLSYVDWSAPTILTMQVGENELRILHRTGVTRLNARGKRIEGTLRNMQAIDLFSRPVFSHQFYLHKHSQRDEYFAIELADWGLQYEGYDRSSSVKIYDVNQPPPDDSSYAAFLHGAEPGAANSWGLFLVPARKKGQLDRITLVSIDPYVWFINSSRFVEARRWEVALPPEAGTRLRRLRGLGADYLVSTDQATFLVRHAGTFTQLWEAGASHAFVMEGIWYADLEGTLYHSTDEGHSWQHLGPGASRLGTGEYFVLDDQLVYAREDSLYQVAPETGAIHPLDTRGLADNQITSVVSFADSIYVGTLTGLYTKPRHALY